MGITTVGTLSGGVGSWAACRLWIDEHGPGGMALLFADTGYEHPDTYRFRDDAATDLGVPLHIVTSGKDIWDVFRDHRWIGNSQLAHCSWDLKTIPCREWLDREAPGATVLVGIDVTEADRRMGDIVAITPPTMPALRWPNRTGGRNAPAIWPSATGCDCPRCTG